MSVFRASRSLLGQVVGRYGASNTNARVRLSLGRFARPPAETGFRETGFIETGLKKPGQTGLNRKENGFVRPGETGFMQVETGLESLEFR